MDKITYLILDDNSSKIFDWQFSNKFILLGCFCDASFRLQMFEATHNVNFSKICANMVCANQF